MKSKKVKQYTRDGVLLRIWDSISDAAKSTGTNHSSIGLVCRRKLKTTNNFIWRYIDDEITELDISNLNTRRRWSESSIRKAANKRLKPVKQYSLSGSFIKEWDSIRDASEALNLSYDVINNVCRRAQKKAGEFIWRYSDETEEDRIAYMRSVEKKKCYNEKYRQNQHNKDRYKQLRRKNKAKKIEYDKKYRAKNKKRKRFVDKNYYDNNKDAILLKQQEYYENNKTKYVEYYEDNKEKISKQRRIERSRNALYELYHDKLTIDESPRLASDGNSLEVKCRYCGKYFIPTKSQVRHRISALNNTSAEKNLYCSEECKVLCPLFNAYALVPNKSNYRQEVSMHLRHIVFERDNYKCVKCGQLAEECHHKDPVAYEPMLQADPDSCIAVCKGCHDEIHRQPGCTYSDLRKFSHNNCKIDLDKQ